MNDLIKSALPTIATALGGPLAGVAVNFLASKLGVDATNEAVTQHLSGMTAAQLVQMKQLDLDFQKHMADNNIAIDLAQIDVNKEEAKHESIFVSGARPFLIWIGGFSLAYATIVDPFIRFIAQVGFKYTGAFPLVDTTLTMGVLAGALGISALRSQDKKNGV